MAENRYADWLERGRAHRAQGRPVDAMLCFQRAAALEPRAVDARYLLGEVQWQMGAIDAAIASWREASRVDPGHVESQLALAEARLATGDTEGAADAAESAVALAPHERHARILHGVAAFASGRDGNALAALAQAIAGQASGLDSPVTGGTLARALALTPSAPGVASLFDALVPHVDRVAFALLPRMLAAANAVDASAPLREARGRIVQVALDRPITVQELDSLRELALALAPVHREASEAVSAKYAQACVAFARQGAPLRWPLRAAGSALRLAAILPAEASSAARALELLCNASARVAIECTLLLSGDVLPAGARVPSNAVVRAIGGLRHEAVAAALASEDPDLLLDFAGITAATGPLLALRPARAIAGVRLDSPPHDAALIGEIIEADDDAIGALLARERARIASLPHAGLSAGALNAAFTDAVEQHRIVDRERARAGYEAVLAAQPDHAPTLHLLAMLNLEEAQTDAAATLVERALRVAPTFADARVSAARIARQRGNVEQGLALVTAGLELDAHNQSLWRLRGELELARNGAAAAEAAFARGLALNPIGAEAHYNLGVALQKQGRHNDAARAYQRALAFAPDLADAHFNMGVVFQESGHPAAAVAAYRAVLERDPKRVRAYKNLGEVLLAAGRIDEYLANFKRFEDHCPEALPLAVQALEACHFAADAAGLERYLDGLRAERFRAEDAAELAESLEQLLYLLLFFDVEPEMLFRFARTYAATAPLVYGPALPQAEMRKPGRVRIGYLSADLRNHVMGKMMWQALRHHDRERFEIHLYSGSRVEDSWTERFRSVADRFDVIADLSDRDAAKRIAANDLDVLVDLSGHTKGAKPGILASKPARVQITHVASAGSVGLATVDFKLTDSFADVPDNQQSMIETLLPMAGCVYPYRHIDPAASHPFNRAALGLSSDAVVIGAFVTPMKLSRRCLALWRDILLRLPRARLAFSPTHPGLRTVFERICIAAGIARDRIVFIPQGRDDAENQARYAVVDLVLDPMPFGGVNGVLEPLDAGVPVVTLAGKRHGERSAYSILANLGVTLTVAQTGREYVDIAVRLVEDRTFMTDVKNAIQRGLKSSSLVDMIAHTRNLEAAYLESLRQRA